VGLIDNFTSVEGAPPLRVESRTLFLSSLKAKPGERITIPILVDEPSNIISGEIEVRFDGRLLRIIEARSDFELESRVEGEELKLAFTGSKARRSKELIQLEFEVKGRARECASLNLKKGKLNEGVKLNLIDGQVKITPMRNELLQNYPNPFNPDTWIPFNLAKGGDVVIRIYDVAGRLIRELDLGYMEPGSYVSRSKAAHWDGRNELGEKVASGIYIYQMEVGDKRFIRRMVILK